MNRPTPDPSQEGSKRSSAPCQFPSWEGLGVGSWSQCTASKSWGLSLREREQQVTDASVAGVGSANSLAALLERRRTIRPLPGICLSCGGRWVCSADFQSAVSPTCSRQGVGSVPRVGVSQRLAECNSAIRRDTAQRGEAATKGARVCDPQELCRPPSVLTNPAHRSLSTCCGSQSRAPQSRRGLRRFEQILAEYNSALRWDAKQVLSPGERAGVAPGRGEQSVATSH
jgi:hypothetical protein